MERKVAWIRQDQERRVVALEERQDNMLRHAQLAEAWADEVEKVRATVHYFPSAIMIAACLRLNISLVSDLILVGGIDGCDNMVVSAGLLRIIIKCGVVLLL